MKVLAELWAPFTTHHFLLTQLVSREIKARYKQSIIGYAWVILNPFLQLVIYTFVFSVIFKFETTVPYPLFLLVPLLPWILVQSALLGAANALVFNANLLKKVSFPREILIYSGVLAKAIDLLVSMGVLSLLFGWYNVWPASTSLVFFLALGMLLILTTGLSLLISALNLLYRDIQYVANLLVTVWFYLTPIVYPVSLVPTKFNVWYRLNPLVGITETFRAAIFGWEIPWLDLLWSSLVSMVIFAFSWWIFKKLEKSFADIV